MWLVVSVCAWLPVCLRVVVCVRGCAVGRVVVCGVRVIECLVVWLRVRTCGCVHLVGRG